MMPSTALQTFIDLAARIIRVADEVMVEADSRLDEDSTDEQGLQFALVEATAVYEYIRQWMLSFDEVDPALYTISTDALARLQVDVLARDLRWAMVGIMTAIDALVGQLRDLLEGTGSPLVTSGNTEDTLQTIAARTLGSWSEWRSLQRTNLGILPGANPAGLLLVVPNQR